MAQSTLSMRKISEVLRLKHEQGLPERTIAATCGMARSTVQSLLSRCRTAGLGWPLSAKMDEAALHALVYPATPCDNDIVLPDFAAIEKERTKKGVTLLLLRQEYKAVHPNGLQYSAICERIAAFRQTQDVVLRQSYRPGEKLFVDFAGPTLCITDRETGVVKQASIFVAALGYSNYTCALATPGQTTADRLDGQRGVLEFIGGVPEVIVPDNPKALVTKACRYEPDLNPAYQDFARHYQTAVVPARVRKPRDKAKVEGGVLIVERWILARLRHHTFFSVAEANIAIGDLIDELNGRPFKKLPGNRRMRFIEEERARLNPLPATAYEFARWKPARVHLDYHRPRSRGALFRGSAARGPRWPELLVH